MCALDLQTTTQIVDAFPREQECLFDAQYSALEKSVTTGGSAVDDGLATGFAVIMTLIVIGGGTCLERCVF